jgi:hypothetical protein
MGLSNTRWEAKYEDHIIAVYRNELTRGFHVDLDGQPVARKVWSWLGFGEVEGKAVIDGREVAIRVALEFGPGTRASAGQTHCSIHVDGKEIEVQGIS